MLCAQQDWISLQNNTNANCTNSCYTQYCTVQCSPYLPFIYSWYNLHTTKYTHNRGEFLTVQKGNVCASSWMDRKVVTVMSTTSQPESTNVLRRQKDGSRISVPCPMSVLDYNTYMGSVDRGDQVRGYYSCRTKCRKFYKYIFHFLLDVAITNAFILQKGYCEDAPFSSIKEFELKLASELIGDYCSRKRAGRSGGVVCSLALRQFLPPFLRAIPPRRQSTGEHTAPGVTAGQNGVYSPRGTVLSVMCGCIIQESRTQTAS